MMAEIINNCDAPRFPAYLLSPRDSGEAFQSRANFGIEHPVEAGGRHRHGCIANIELTDQRDLERFVAQRESRTFVGVGDIPNSLRRIFGKTDLHDRGKAISRYLHAIWIIAVQQDHSVLRNDVEQAAEAQLDFVETAKNIGVIELNVIYDDQFRQVVNEL